MPILEIVGGGLAGSALTYGLTWYRERRRTVDAYRAPQRQAIADVVAATHELALRADSFRRVLRDAAGQAEGGENARGTTLKELDEIGDQLNRAVLGVDRAIQLGRLSIVDATLFEGLGIAHVRFVSITQLLPQITALGSAGDATAIRQVEQNFKAQVKELNDHLGDLILAGQEIVSPVQSWRNKRQRKRTKKELEAKYFAAKSTGTTQPGAREAANS